MCKIELKEEKKASCPNFPCFWPFPRRAAGLEYEMNKKTEPQRKNESDQKCYGRSSSQNDLLLLPKVADISCFAAKRKPSSHLQTLLPSFRELLLLLGGSFYAILVNSCTFLWKGVFSYHNPRGFFSPIIEAEGFMCFVVLTGLQGEEKVHLMFQDVQEKSKESNKWKFRQLGCLFLL